MRAFDLASCDGPLARRSIAGAVSCLLVLVSGCCTTNVVIRRSPGASTGVLGALQRCTAPEVACVSDPSNDTSRFNGSNTALIAMPECAFGFNRILVQDSGSSHPVVIAECAGPPQHPAPPAGGGLPITQPGGGVGPNP